MNTNCRIGKVTYKNAPNLVDLRPIERDPLIPRSVAKQKLYDILDYLSGEELAGLVIVAWTAQGSFDRYTNYKSRPISETMLPAFIAEIIRRDYSQQDTCDILNQGPIG